MCAAALLQKRQRCVKLGITVFRQGQHNIAANFRKPGLPRPGKGLRSAPGRMGAPQPPQLGVAGALHPKADACHACRTKTRQAFRGHHIRVGFQRDFRPRQGICRCDQAFQLLRCQQRRRTAAKIQRIGPTVIFGKLPQQSVHIGLRHAPRPGGRVEITIPAFGPAVGDMQVDPV